MVQGVLQFALGCLLTLLQYKSGTDNFNLSLVSAVFALSFAYNFVAIQFSSSLMGTKLGFVQTCQLILPLFVLYYFLPVIWHGFVSIYLL